MFRQILRTVLTGVLFLAGTSAVATEAPQTAGPTREWTATRQPRQESRPLPSDGKGSDFSLLDQQVTPFSLGLFAPVQYPEGKVTVRGMRFSPVYGRCANLTGLDLGLVNTVEREFIGLQIGLFNSASRARGVQAGLLNCAYYLKGVQVGLINYAEGACGLQIGLVNVITNTTPGVMPLIYGSF